MFSFKQTFYFNQNNEQSNFFQEISLSPTQENQTEAPLYHQVLNLQDAWESYSCNKPNISSSIFYLTLSPQETVVDDCLYI